MNHNSFFFNVESLSPELRLLLICMKTKNEDCFTTEIKPWLTDIDWNLFIELVRHHRVYPLVYMRLKKLTEGSVPPDIIQDLALDYRNNIFQMLHLSGEMESLFRIYDDHGIKALMLKGPVIAKDLYGDLSLRTAKDLDILVQKSDLKRGEDLLLQLGYERIGEGEHHFCYYHFKKAINIEIHWRLHPDLGQEPSFSDLWERRRITPLTTYPISFLGKEDLMLYLVPHGARHGWFRLRWLGDIDRLVSKELNWNNLIPRITEYRYEHMIGQACLLTQELLDTPVPFDAQPFLRTRKAGKLAQLATFYLQEKWDKESHLPWAKYLKDKYYYFTLLPDRRLKWVYIKSHFYPQSIDRETLPLPKSMEKLYFFLRPGLWIWRKVRKI